MSAAAKRVDRAALSTAVLLLIAAGVVFWDARRLAITAIYGMGPDVVPMVIAAGLGLLAVANLVTAWRGDVSTRESIDLRAIVLILGGLAAVIALIGFGGGFMPATAILFATTAAAFGRRAFVTDLVIGLVLGLVIFLMFDKLLTLSLPAGPIERLL